MVNAVGEDRAVFRLSGGLAIEKIAIRQFTVETSWHHISAAAGNTFNLEEGGVALLTTVPPGNYTIATFATALAAALNAAGANTYAVAANLDSGLLTITRTAGAAAWRLLFAGFARMAHVCGFTGAVPAAGAGPFTGAAPVWLRPAWVYLNCPQLAAIGGSTNMTVGALAIGLAGSGLFGGDTSQGISEFDTFAILGHHLTELEFYLSDVDGGGAVLGLNNGRFCVEVWALDRGYL